MRHFSPYKCNQIADSSFLIEDVFNNQISFVMKTGLLFKSESYLNIDKQIHQVKNMYPQFLSSEKIDMYIFFYVSFQCCKKPA